MPIYSLAAKNFPVAAAEVLHRCLNLFQHRLSSCSGFIFKLSFFRVSVSVDAGYVVITMSKANMICHCVID